MQERDYYLGFSLVSGIGPKTFALLLQYFKTAQKAWNSNSKELKIQNIRVKKTSQNLKLQNLSKEELQIMKVLENENLGFDEIVRKTKIDASKLAGIISMMEIKGLLGKSNGSLYVIAS